MKLNQRHPWSAGLAAAAVSGALYFFSTGLNPVGPLLLVAPLPVLIASVKLSAGKTFAIAVLGFLIGEMCLVTYLCAFMLFPFLVIAMVISASAFGLSVLAHRGGTLKLNPVISAFCFPAAWTAFEFVRSISSPHGTAGSFAYTQTSFLALIQVSSLAGIWGVTFVASLIPSALAVMWKYRKTGREFVTAAAVPALIVLVVLVFGWVRLHQDWRPQKTPVGLAVTDTTIKYVETKDISQSIPVINAYANRADDLARFGARIVVLPEKFASVTNESTSLVDSIFSRTAEQDSITIVAGLNVIGGRRDSNVAAVYFPDGKILKYYKKFLVPGFEAAYYSGSSPLTFSVGERTTGVEICKDMDFPEWSREYSMRGATIMLVPAWDFTTDADFHMRMALMRGVENGFSIVRCAQNGLLTISDYAGRLSVYESSSRSPEVLVLGYVAPGPGRTFYSTAGDWFGWLCIAATVGLVLLMIPGTRKVSPP